MPAPMETEVNRKCKAESKTTVIEISQNVNSFRFLFSFSWSTWSTWSAWSTWTTFDKVTLSGDYKNVLRRIDQNDEELSAKRQKQPEFYKWFLFYFSYTRLSL